MQPSPLVVHDRRLALVLLAIALLAIVAPLVIVLRAPHLAAVPRHRVAIARRVVPEAELPPVEPVAFQDLSADDARAVNADVPFVDGPVAPARPFRFMGDDEQRARAIDCLAAALLYEAGDDPEGQRAVAQVILNRARHPAFPKTICGVVFQGSERPTGCQFTFTCDGSLVRRRWSDDAWQQAREIAGAALAGAVDRQVGYATHYHTDWVVPYWSASLDKIAAVHTHLFFRWTGWWGTAPAFNRRLSPEEPVIAALAAFSPAHAVAVAMAEVTEIIPVRDEVAAANIAQLAAPGTVPAAAASSDPNSFLVLLDPHAAPDGFAALAARTCADRPYCKVMGWTDRGRLPASLPLQTQQIATMSFSYLRDRARHYDKALWNCAEFRRHDATQCMRVQVPIPVQRQVDGLPVEQQPGAMRTLPFATGLPVPTGLSGVHRRVAPHPLPTATARTVAPPAPDRRAPAMRMPDGRRDPTIRRRQTSPAAAPSAPPPRPRSRDTAPRPRAGRARHSSAR